MHSDQLFVDPDELDREIPTAEQLGCEPINCVVFPDMEDGGLRFEDDCGWIKADDETVIFDVSDVR